MDAPHFQAWCRIVVPGLIAIACVEPAYGDVFVRRIPGAQPRVFCNRFELLDAGDGQVGTGSGLVFDTQTGRTWLRVPWYGVSPLTQSKAGEYCASRGMRLATKEELLRITRPNICKAAWPTFWFTWSSTPAGEGRYWVVAETGFAGPMKVEASYQALCVESGP